MIIDTLDGPSYEYEWNPKAPRLRMATGGSWRTIVEQSILRAGNAFWAKFTDGNELETQTVICLRDPN